MGYNFITFFLMFLVWAVWTVLNLWIWQKAKATGNLLMMVGGAVVAVLSLLGAFGAHLAYDAYYWLLFLSFLALTAGFYLSVKPMVAAQIAALGSKVRAGADAKKA